MRRIPFPCRETLPALLFCLETPQCFRKNLARSEQYMCRLQTCAGIGMQAGTGARAWTGHSPQAMRSCRLSVPSQNCRTITPANLTGQAGRMKASIPAYALPQKQATLSRSEKGLCALRAKPQTMTTGRPCLPCAVRGDVPPHI